MLYKGKGEHSVKGLETIIEIQQEQIHLLKLQESKAPEMLEMLKKCLNVAESLESSTMYSEIKELIKSATELKEESDQRKEIDLKGEWEDDLIWCPSQCYYEFDYEGIHYAIYLRWRHSDPWTADLVENWLGQEIWHDLLVDFFRDDQLDEVKAQALELTKAKLQGLER